jgi:arylsulfatase A-like enzyme
LIDRRTFLIAPLAFARGAELPTNLVLIVANGWRGQATPWDGDLDLVAPNLKAFGEQSVVFSRAYSCCPKAELAQTALLTSKYPHAARDKDEVLGNPKLLTVKAAQQAFAKSPFAVRVSLASAGGPGSGRVHSRGNVPSEKEPQARADLTNFYGGRSADDSVLGEILGALDKLNAAKDTVVCFTSDCGQQLGSHGLDGGDVFFEESVRIPLAIRYPRKLKPDARDLASQVDIMPTLLTLCGMEIPEGVQGVDLLGKTPPEVIFSEGKFGEPDEWRMLVRGYDKIVATPKGEITNLFNLADDPYELTDLAHDPAQKLKLASLKAQLQAQMKKLGDGMDPSGLRKR